MTLALLDYIVFIAYFAIVISFGLWVSRKPKGEERTSEDFFLAARALPWYVIGSSLIAANISAEQMIGMTGAAFAGGLAVVSYEWMAAVTLLFVAKWMLPIFLKMKIYSMPQYLEERFDKRVSMSLGVFWLLVYVFVNLTSVSYLGALTLQKLIGADFQAVTGMEFHLTYGIIGLFAISFIYTLTGGLMAVAWTDIIQVAVLFGGGLAVTYFGLSAMGGGEGLAAGFTNLWNQAPDHFHTVMPWDHNLYPWIGVFIGGMWAANLSYWGCNQYITQRALAGKDLKQAQLGLVFAAFLKVVVPLAVLLPGIVAFALYKDAIPKPDQAYSILVSKMVPAGFVGLIIAGLVAAIVSSLNSMVNSTATIFTMDIYRKINPTASERTLVTMGRIVSVVVVLIAIPIAPYLRNLDQAFQYIQEYTGMVSPGVTIIFFMGLFWRRATATAALWMAILTIPVSAALKFVSNPLYERFIVITLFGSPLYRIGFAFFISSLIGFGLFGWENSIKKYVSMVITFICLFATFTLITIYPIPGTIVGRFLDPFLNRMGVSMVILFIVGYFITMATPYVKHDKYEKMEESVSFKTSAIFNVFAILILGALTALYLIFR